MKSKGGRPPIPNMQKISAVLNVLKSYPKGIYLRRLSRESGVPASTVLYYLEKYLDLFTESGGATTDEGKFIGIRIVKLKAEKENTTLEDVIKYIELKRRIRNR